MEENGSGSAVIHLYEDITIFTALPFTICQILKMLVFMTIKIDQFNFMSGELVKYVKAQICISKCFVNPLIFQNNSREI